MYPTKTSCLDSLDNMEAAYVHAECLIHLHSRLDMPPIHSVSRICVSRVCLSRDGHGS